MAKTPRKRTALIDGDILVYRIAASIERPTDWGDDLWTLHSNADEGKAILDGAIQNLMQELKATDAVVFVSSPNNFRMSILPTYKGNRAKTRKPVCLGALRQHLIDAHNAVIVEGLEADDMMGIASTDPATKGEKIIVSLDKDMKTIPGLYFNDRMMKPVLITEEEADYWHLFQTLTGDTTDGYSGCPGVGPGTAEAALKGLLKQVPYDHTMQRGKRSGEVEIRYREEPAESMWAVVLSFYAKAGLTEADALVQARVARILRHSDYDFKKKEPILWRP